MIDIEDPLADQLRGGNESEDLREFTAFQNFDGFECEF